MATKLMCKMLVGSMTWLVAATQIAACGSWMGTRPNSSSANPNDGEALVAFARNGGRVIGYVRNDTEFGDWFEADDFGALDGLT